MIPLNLDDVCIYVNDHIDQFHQRRIEIIGNLSLTQLTNKNPYLFRAKNISKAADLIEGTLEAFLSSSEEKLFGDFLEDLAIYIAGKTTGGHKSTAPGIDLEFEKDGIYHIVSIKSGPNWGNSSQHGKLALDFADAERRLRQSKHISHVEKVLGICYGKARTVTTRHGYIKVLGQNFWAYISNNKNLYIDIIEPLGYNAREHNERYLVERNRITNVLTKMFIDKFCNVNGEIDWARLIQANSGNYDLDKFS
jgi:hypothetical protein